MYLGRFTSIVVVALLSLVACSSEVPDDQGAAGASSSGSGGAPLGGGGNSSSAGAALTGGSTSAMAGMTGAGSPAAGGAEMGGSGGAGSGGVSTGGGGQSGGGSAGSGGSSSQPAKASAGCSRNSTQVTIANSIVSLPPGYTGTQPLPAVIGFHAAGNDNTSIANAFKGSDLASKYVMIFPNSSGNGWNMSADKGRYTDAYAGLLSQACVDENRIYATGHSSGAQFVVQLLCSGDAKFNGVAPVASSVYCSKWKNGPVPALIIHGVQDSERQAYGLNDGNGQKDLQPYLTSNMCEMTSTPFDPDLSKCGNVKNGIDGKPFDDGCVEFSGCSVKTRWCNHNDPNYGTSNHGIPCFGVRAIYDFFESL